MSRSVRFLGCLMALSLCATSWAGDTTLTASNGTANIGGTATVTVTSGAGFDLSGFSYGLCDVTGSLLIADPMDVIPGVDLAALGPDFFAPATPGPGAGDHTVGCVVSFSGMAAIPAGDNEVASITYQENVGVEGVYDLCFCDTLGSPLVITTVVDTNGQGVAPAGICGSVEVADDPPFKFVADTDGVTLTYPVDNPGGGSAQDVTLSIVDQQGLNTATQGFSFAIAIDDQITLENSAVTGDLAATNGGAGPDFFGSNNSPVGGNGFTAGVVVSFAGMDTLDPAGPPNGSTVVALTLRANPASPAPGNNGDLPLTWTDSLGDPLVINTVVVSGQGQGVLFCDGLIRLFGTSDIPFVRGDCNDDGLVDIADGITVIQDYVVGGMAPLGDCVEACDANDDDQGPDVSDASYIFNYRFLGGPPPPAPFPDCGAVPGADCNSYNNCP